MRRIPLHALFLSLLAGLAALPAVVAVLALVPGPARHPHLTAFGAAAALGCLFGLLWPSGSWRWGVPVSASLWIYFGFVFVALWTKRQLEWAPGGDALASLLVACAGAYAGGRLSPRSRSADGRPGARRPC